MTKRTLIICLQLQTGFSMYLNIYIELSFCEILSYIPSFHILLERINILSHFLLSEIYSKIEYRSYKMKGRSSLGIVIKKYSGTKTLRQKTFVASIIWY